MSSEEKNQTSKDALDSEAKKEAADKAKMSEQDVNDTLDNLEEIERGSDGKPASVKDDDTSEGKSQGQATSSSSQTGFIANVGSRVSRLLKNVRDAKSRSELDDISEDDLLEVHFVNNKDTNVDDLVPKPLRVAAAWSWRLLVVAALIWVFAVYILYELSIVVVPVLLAMLFAVLLEPVLRLFHIHLHFPRTLAAAVTVLLSLGAVIVLLGTASSQLITSMSDVVDKARAGVTAAIRMLGESPLNLDTTKISKLVNESQSEIQRMIKENSGDIMSGAMGVASTATSIVSGFLILLFCLFFFLKDGRKIWQWMLLIVPKSVRYELNEGVIRGWVTLGSYVRTQMAVAAIDAIGIGIGAFFIINGSLALPIGVLVFIGSFIPIVGAITVGIIAVLVALVVQGFNAAIWMLVVILVVQQVESNLLQPFMMSSAVSLHPVVVLLAVVAGGYIAGIMGAIFSVPLVAFVNTTVLYMQGHDKFLKLNFDYTRSGGPPGSLTKEMDKMLKPLPENIAEAAKMREKAIAKGYLDHDGRPIEREEAEATS